MFFFVFMSIFVRVPAPLTPVSCMAVGVAYSMAVWSTGESQDGAFGCLNGRRVLFTEVQEENIVSVLRALNRQHLYKMYHSTELPYSLVYCYPSCSITTGCLTKTVEVILFVIETRIILCSACVPTVVRPTITTCFSSLKSVVRFD